jgi:ATP-dependent DNA ligase
MIYLYIYHNMDKIAANQKQVIEFMDKYLKLINGEFITKTLKSIDPTGRKRIWYIIINGEQPLTREDVVNKTNVRAHWKSIFGLEEGQKTYSESKSADGKNIGKKNATTSLTQVILDVRSEFNNQIKRGCFLKMSRVDRPYPMALHNIDKNKNWQKIQFPCYIQPKYDGTLYIVMLNKGELEGYSRGREVYLGQEHILRELEPIRDILADSYFLIGELWRRGFSLQDVSGASRHAKNDDPPKLEYWIFDCSRFLGADSHEPKYVDSTPFPTRQMMLDKIFATLGDTMYAKRVPTRLVHNRGEADQCHKGFLADGLEGSILRNFDAPYEWGLRGEIRVYHTMKWKPRFDDEFPLVGFKEGMRGKEKGLVIFEFEHKGKHFSATPNWPSDMRREAYIKLQDLRFWDKVRGKAVTIQYSTRSRDGVPQQPKVILFRDPNIQKLFNL